MTRGFPLNYTLSNIKIESPIVKGDLENIDNLKNEKVGTLAVINSQLYKKVSEEQEESANWEPIKNIKIISIDTDSWIWLDDGSLVKSGTELDEYTTTSDIITALQTNEVVIEINNSYYFRYKNYRQTRPIFRDVVEFININSTETNICVSNLIISSSGINRLSTYELPLLNSVPYVMQSLTDLDYELISRFKKGQLVFILKHTDNNVNFYNCPVFFTADFDLGNDAVYCTASAYYFDPDNGYVLFTSASTTLNTEEFNSL